MKELLIKTNNPESLDKIVNQLGGVIEQGIDGNYAPANVFKYGKDVYACRSLSGDIGFLKFSIENQGYGKIVGEREI